MKKVVACVLLSLSLGWGAEGWVKSQRLKNLKCFSRGLCFFEVSEADSTSYAFDASSDGGKNMLSLLLSVKSIAAPFRIYDTGKFLPGTKVRMADGISVGDD